MTEKQLNESIIKDKIQGICQDCMYLDKIVPILNQMLNETYIDGLEQGKFDKQMETMYDNTKKSRLTNTTRENNQYYEPTIKTIRNENKMEKYLYNHNYISNNKKSNYQQELSAERAECIINKHNSIMEDEKQQLISFLEDRINICDGVIDTTKSDLEETQFTFNCKQALENTLEKNELAKRMFQKVLDFVNKGGKE